jgi:hypothetical protein
MALKQQINFVLLTNAITDILSVEVETSENDKDDISQCLLLFQNFANYFRSKINAHELETNKEPSRVEFDLDVTLATDEPTGQFDDSMVFEITDGVGKEGDEIIEDDAISENEVREGSPEKQSTLENQSLHMQKSDSLIENDLNSLMLRVKVAKEKKARYWKCIKCDFSAKLKGSMVRHVELHHTAMLYNCGHCEYETKTSRGLANHMQENHGIKLKKKGRVYKAGKGITEEYDEIAKPPKVVLCNDCGKEFILTSTLIKNQYRTHLAKHKGPYQEVRFYKVRKKSF